jgi:hypothetical protein
LRDGILELFDEWGSIDFQPADINLGLHFCNVVLDGVKESDLFIKGLKAWFFSTDANENLFSHPVESLILFFFSVIVNLCMLNLPWINASIKEGLEAFRKSFLPQKLFVLICCNEVSSSLFDVSEIISNYLY